MAENRLIAQDEPRGIGGWLYPFAIVVALAPVFIAWRALRNAQSAVALFTAEASLATWFWIGLEFLVTLGVLAGSLYVAYLFFSKKRILPRAYVWFVAAALCASAVSFITGAVVLATEIDSEGLPFDLVNWRAPIVGVIWALVSTTYLARSRRVRNTFQND